MKKSDAINSKYPSPLDSEVLKIWKEFLAEKQEIMKLWLQDVASGRVAARGFADFQNARMDLTPMGDVVVSLKPMLGELSYYKLALYKRFFMTYRLYSNALDVQLMATISERKIERHPRIDVIKLKEKKPSGREIVHTLIMSLKILVTAMRDGTLTLDNITLFDNIAYVAIRNKETVEAINSLVRELNLTHVMSDKFAHGGNFFDHPEPILTQAYWRYGHKKYELTSGNTIVS